MIEEGLIKNVKLAFWLSCNPQPPLYLITINLQTILQIKSDQYTTYFIENLSNQSFVSSYHRQTVKIQLDFKWMPATYFMTHQLFVWPCQMLKWSSKRSNLIQRLNYHHTTYFYCFWISAGRREDGNAIIIEILFIQLQDKPGSLFVNLSLWFILTPVQKKVLKYSLK